MRDMDVADLKRLGRMEGIYEVKPSIQVFAENGKPGLCGSFPFPLL
jgi:hypothetical protein